MTKQYQNFLRDIRFFLAQFFAQGENFNLIVMLQNDLMLLLLKVKFGEWKCWNRNETETTVKGNYVNSGEYDYRLNEVNVCMCMCVFSISFQWKFMTLSR